MEQEIQGLREQLEFVQWDLDTKTNDYPLLKVETLRNQLTRTRSDLEATNSELITIRQQRDADIEWITQLEKQCADINALIESEMGDVSALKSRNQELYSSYGTKLFEMTTLENQLADANQKVADLTQQLSSTQSSIDELAGKNDLLEKDAQSVTVLREQLADLESSNAKLQEEVVHF